MITLMVSHFSHCLVHGLVVLHLHFNMPSTVSMARLSLWTLLGCISDTGWWARGASDFMMIICTCEKFHDAYWSPQFMNSFGMINRKFMRIPTCSWLIWLSFHLLWSSTLQAGMSGAVIFASWSWEGSNWDGFFFGEASTIRISIWSINIHFLFPLSKEPSNTMQNFTNNFKASANVTFTSLKNWKI